MWLISSLSTLRFKWNQRSVAEPSNFSLAPVPAPYIFFRLRVKDIYSGSTQKILAPTCSGSEKQLVKICLHSAPDFDTKHLKNLNFNTKKLQKTKIVSHMTFLYTSYIWEDAVHAFVQSSSLLTAERKMNILKSFRFYLLVSIVSTRGLTTEWSEGRQIALWILYK